MTAYYVDAINGSDINLGTEDQPFRNIVRGLSVLTPGDTLYARAGNYAESLYDVFPSGLSWAAPVTLAAYPGEPVVVKPAGGLKVIRFARSQYNIVDGLILDGANVDAEVIRITAEAHHIRIQNSEVKGAPRQGILVNNDYAIDSDYNEFINVDVHDNGTTDFDHGMYIETKNNLVDRCSVHHNSGWGVHIYSGTERADENLVRYSKCFENAQAGGNGAGILLSSGKGNKAHHNLLWGNRRGLQVVFQDVSDAEVYNNVVFGNQAYGIDIGPDSVGAIIRNNISFQNGWGDSIIDLGVDTVKDYNLEGIDPQFINVDLNDFRLQATSPARDAGLWVGLDKDFVGTSIPQGSAPDIGAYEYKENEMSVITDLQVVEADLRAQAITLTISADAVLAAINNLKAVDDALDAAADVIEED